jgi:hypothetical protein
VVRKNGGAIIENYRDRGAAWFDHRSSVVVWFWCSSISQGGNLYYVRTTKLQNYARALMRIFSMCAYVVLLHTHSMPGAEL